MPGFGQPATNRLLAASVRPSLSMDHRTGGVGEDQMLVGGTASPACRRATPPTCCPSRPLRARGPQASTTTPAVRPRLPPGQVGRPDHDPPRPRQHCCPPRTSRPQSSPAATPATSIWSSWPVTSSRRTECRRARTPLSSKPQPLVTGCSTPPACHSPSEPTGRTRTPEGNARNYMPCARKLSGPGAVCADGAGDAGALRRVGRACPRPTAAADDRSRPPPRAVSHRRRDGAVATCRTCASGIG